MVSNPRPFSAGAAGASSARNRRRIRSKLRRERCGTPAFRNLVTRTQCPGPQGPNVDSYGRWVTDPSRFPPQGDTNGIKLVADYVHSMGMKFGIYVTPGISNQAVSRNTSIEGTPYTAAQIANSSVKESNYNCKGMVRIDYRKPGAQEFIDSWVKMLSGWGTDYIKIDGMKNSNAPDVEAWSKAIRKSGRPIVLDVTQGSFTAALTPTLMKYADQWEFAPDIECYRCEKGSSSYPLTSWKDVSNRFNFVADWQPYSGSGRFNDYDSIEIGNGSNDGLTPVERQTQLSLWALGAAPLILGVDLTNLDQEDLQKYLKNAAILAVDQDSIAAKRVVNNGEQQVFAKVERNGDAIMGLFNAGETEKKISSIEASAVGLSENKKRLLHRQPVDGREEKNQRGHRCGCPTAWGGLIPRQGALIAYSLTRRLQSILRVQIKRARDFARRSPSSATESRSRRPATRSACWRRRECPTMRHEPRRPDRTPTGCSPRRNRNPESRCKD
jgi:Alpha galactosidase A